MAKDRNTVAKRQREMEKKRKAEEKRTRRQLNQQRKGEPAILVEEETASRSASEGA